MNQPPPPPPGSGSGPETPPGQGWGGGDQPPPPPPGQQPWPPQDPAAGPPPTQPMQVGGQPAQPYGQPAQPYGQGGFPPPGQQPPTKKKKTGLVVGGVIGAIALIAIVVGVALAVTGDDDEGDEPRADESSQEANSSDEPTEEPSDPASEDSGAGGDETAEPAPDGSTLQGTGYSYALPEGWQDISAQVTGANPDTFIDTAASWGPSIEEGRGNVIVENPPAGGADSAEALEQLRSNFTSQFPDAEIDDADPRTIGDEEMLGLELSRTNESGVEVDQEAYVAVIDDVAYIITASSTSDDDAAEDQFEQIYDSWTWE